MMTEHTLNEMELFLGQIIMTIAHDATKKQAAYILNRIRYERGTDPGITTYGSLAK